MEMYQSVLYCQILNVFELKYAEYKPLHCFRISVIMQRTNPLILSVSVSSTVPLSGSGGGGEVSVVVNHGRREGNLVDLTGGRSSSQVVLGFWAE